MTRREQLATISVVAAHALFSDAASAVVLEPGPLDAGRPAGGLTFVDMVAVADHSTADHMTWDVTDLGFRMGLSPEVPAVPVPPVALSPRALARPERKSSSSKPARRTRCCGFISQPER